MELTLVQIGTGSSRQTAISSIPSSTVGNGWLESENLFPLHLQCTSTTYVYIIQHIHNTRNHKSNLIIHIFNFAHFPCLHGHFHTQNTGLAYAVVLGTLVGFIPPEDGWDKAMGGLLVWTSKPTLFLETKLHSLCPSWPWLFCLPVIRPYKAFFVIRPVG